MTVFLVGYKSDDWFDDRLVPMLELGYFDTREEAEAWIAQGDFVKAEYTKEVENISNYNTETKNTYAKNIADWEAAQAAGLGHLVEEPVQFYERKVESYDEFASGWVLEPIPVERGV